MSDLLGLGLTAVLLALNAFFVGAEFALVSARRAAVEPRAEAGVRSAVTTIKAMEHLSMMMAGAQLGITVCSLALGSLSEPAIAHLIEPGFAALGLPEALVHPFAFVVALALVTVLHVVLGEMVPKNVALAGPDRAALWFGPPMYYVCVVLRPVVVTFNWLANHVLRLVRVEPQDEVSSTFSREQVSGLVEESAREGLLDEDERELLAGALSFVERTVATVLLPLDQLRTVPREVTPRGLEAAAAETGFSRFPVHGARGDDLVGYLHLKDVLSATGAQRTAPVAERLVRPLPRVTEQTTLADVLASLRGSGAHLAEVVAGPGGAEGTTLGVVALEDVLEELVGQIRDEVRSARAPEASTA